MQAQREAPPDMQCKDKFLVQSVVLPDDADHKEVSQDLVSNNFISTYVNLLIGNENGIKLCFVLKS